MLKQIKIVCNRCNNRTQHRILAKKATLDKIDFDENNYDEFVDIYQIVQCMGCEQISFLHISSNSKETDSDGTPICTHKIYPPRISRRRPEWLNQIFCNPFWTGETVVEKLLNEIYTALHNNLPRLAGMGTRSLIEHVIIDKIGDHGTFADNVEAFFQQGYISKSQVEQLKSVLDVGHAAMHRGYEPTVQQINDAMDVIEGIIANVYIHPLRKDRLTKNIPRRERAK